VDLPLLLLPPQPGPQLEGDPAGGVGKPVDRRRANGLVGGGEQLDPLGPRQLERVGERVDGADPRITALTGLQPPHRAHTHPGTLGQHLLGKPRAKPEPPQPRPELARHPTPSANHAKIQL
jgi:hypothetical protein